MALVRRVVTTRAGGVSAPPYDEFDLAHHVGDDPVAVEANRVRLAAGVGLAPDRLVWMRQVHGTTVTVVDGPRPAEVPDCDGLVTAAPALVLAVLVADCVPVLLADPTAGVVAAVHAGRAGSRDGVLLAALDVMRSLGASPARTDALLGPAICGPCYEVPAGMQRDMASALPGSAVPARGGGAGVDLRAGLRRQLFAAGVRTVAVDARCTREDPTLYSHRRDGVTGRFAGLVWVT